MESPVKQQASDTEVMCADFSGRKVCMQKLLHQFRNPGSEYRGAPFWAWNGKLEPEELRRQIRLMQRMGLGGFFMHSRVGLNTAYLSDEWFECINACVDEAERLDMQAWLYDEDRWPSGAAGGLVTKKPKYRMRRLVMTEFSGRKEMDAADNVLAYFTAVKNAGGALEKLKPVPESKLPVKGLILRFHAQVASPSSWYNDQTYLDTLNHEAVKEFVRVTHEKYKKRLGRKLGGRVPGIFTDEPNYGGICVKTSDNRAETAWTDKLPEIFRQRYGYDIMERLPEIFFDLDGQAMSQARYHYVDCVTHLFVDAFARQIGEWCDKTGCQHTGHLLEEQTPASQTGFVGSAMRFHEYMQVPGMDILTEHRREYDTAKQISSAARQFGRKWRLTETYGCTGWDFPFAGHKAVGDWQVALGINLRCQHLYLYTMKGEAKRDYPASIAHQSSWWEAYVKVEDYFARLHLALTQGEEVRDLLVIHPIESTWTLICKDWDNSAEVKELDLKLGKLRDTLLTAHIDFDYGDEEILSRYGKVAGKTGRPELRVGRACYKAVLVPSLLTIRKTTLELLTEFQAVGGTVVFAAPAPGHVDALPSAAAAELAAKAIQADDSPLRLVRILEKDCRRVSVLDGNGHEIAPVLYLLREDAAFQYLFICNSGHADKEITNGEINDPGMVRDRQRGFDNVTVKLKGICAGAALELDADTGSCYSLSVQTEKDGWLSLQTSLPALGSRLFLIPRKKAVAGLPPRPLFSSEKTVAFKAKTWNIRLSEDNVLMLDQAAHAIGEGQMQPAEEILRIDCKVRDALGIRHHGGRMVQPWARPRMRSPKTVPLRLVYSFQVEYKPSGALWLTVEEPHAFRITLNGRQIVTDQECGWWCDLSLRRLPTDPAAIKTGENILELECAYSETHPGLEIIYLLGDFGTKLKKNERILTAPPASLKTGDWVPQGLPFYSGTITYRLPVSYKPGMNEHVFLHTAAFRGTAIRVRAGDQTAGIIAWPPYEIEVTELLRGAAGELEIDLFTHRRNSHGPFHYAEKWPSWTGPGQFISTGEQWSEGLQLVPCGLMAVPELIVRV